MRGNRDQRLRQTPRHVLDKPGFSASGRPFQHDRQTFGEGGLKHRYLVAHGLIEGFRNNSVGIEVHAHLHGWCVGKPPANVTTSSSPPQWVRQASPYGRATTLERASRHSWNASRMIRLLIAILHKWGQAKWHSRPRPVAASAINDPVMGITRQGGQEADAMMTCRSANPSIS